MTAAKTSPLEGGEEQWEGRKEIEPGWVLASPGRLWMQMIRLILAIQHHHH